MNNLESEARIWLAVPPEQRQAARTAAGRLVDGRSAIVWSKEDQLWYARPGADMTRLRDWLPNRSIRSGGGDPQSEFLDALTKAGLVLDGLPVMDGQRHRVPVLDGKKGNRDGVYRGFLDGHPAGWFINYHTADNEKDITRWKASGGEADPVARLHIRAAMRQSQDDFAREQAALYARRTASAKSLYDSLPAADPTHPYLMRKGITPVPELRQTSNGALVVPFQDADGQFRTLQYIPPEGEKLLYKDAPKVGNFLVVGGILTDGEPILYAEGFATARSLNVVTGRPVVMTIDAGNMVTVAGELKTRYPTSPHLFLADFDHAKKKNKGVLSAERAAAATDGAVILPDLTAIEIERGFTDFNDLHQFRGADGLRATLLPEITLALKRLDYKETSMSTPDDEQNAPGVTPADTTAAAPKIYRRRPGAAKEKADDVLALRQQGMKPAQIAVQLGVGQTSVYRILRAQQQTTAPMEENTSSVTPEATLTASVTKHKNDTAESENTVSSPLPDRKESAKADITPAADPTEMSPGLRAAALSAQGLSLAAIAAEMRLGIGEAYRLMQSIPADKKTDANKDDVVLEKAGATSSAAEASAAAASVKATESVQMDIAPKTDAESALQVLPSTEQPTAVDPAPIVSQSGPSALVAFGEEDGILVGPRRVTPSDEPVPEALKRIDADKLLSRITYETNPDGKSVLYKLDGEPAFIDHGNRLVMAEGASGHEEKVLSALLTAAQHYHGRIELTGSDAFKSYAISLIVKHKLDVSMKVATQQAELDAARRAAGQPVAPVDAVAGTPVHSNSGSAPTNPPKVQPDTPAPAPSTQSGSVSVTASHSTRNTAPVTPPMPEKPRIGPEIHTPAEKAREPVTGKVTACGQAPFRFEPDAAESTFITLRTKEGTQTYWGKEFAGLLRETRLQPGRMVTLQWQGEQPVTVKVPKKGADGVVTHYESVETRRNQWSVTPVGGARVQTGSDELVTLAAFDASRFTQIQHTVATRLQLDIPAPPAPADGLYWLRPDGQGSQRPGDALSAARPAVNAKAGEPVMSSWADDGALDLYLVQGDGHYLQGVVRQSGEYKHVLVSLPDSKEAPPMVFNLLTPEGARPIGSGNGINRSNGNPVPRENVVVRLQGDEKQRIARLDAPAELPPALHARLGFDERWKTEVGFPKSLPVAAPQAAPVTPSRPV